jgi:hypothetical protein
MAIALLVLLIVVILSPEVTFPSCKPFEPTGQEATGRPWSPIVRLIIVVRYNAAITNPTQEPSRAVKYNIAQDATATCQYSNL